MSKTLATVGVPPVTLIAPPLTSSLPAASRLIVIVLSRLSPKTLSVPVPGLNCAGCRVGGYGRRGKHTGRQRGAGEHPAHRARQVAVKCCFHRFSIAGSRSAGCRSGCGGWVLAPGSVGVRTPVWIGGFGLSCGVDRLDRRSDAPCLGTALEDVGQ